MRIYLSNKEISTDLLNCTGVLGCEPVILLHVPGLRVNSNSIQGHSKHKLLIYCNSNIN